jgi:pimeloyl-ACP methyl ester carboxylesterase
VPISLVLTTGSSGTFTSPAWRVVKRSLSLVDLRNDSLYFEFPSTTGAIYSGSGRIVGGVLTGSMRRGADTGAFRAIRVISPSRTRDARYVGIYEAAASLQSSRYMVTFGAQGHLRWENLGANESSPLYPISDSAFVFGAALKAKGDAAVPTVRFSTTTTGAVSAIARAGTTVLTLTRASGYTIRELTYANGSIPLAGTLISPPSRGPLPVVVFVHGSGDASRDAVWYRQFDDFFLQQGLAAFIPDKRGAGCSGGDWHAASFDDLADDVVAAVNALKSQPGIDSTRIAVWGFSQGGWIAPLAATKSRDIALVMVASGGAVSNRDAEIAEQVARMRVQNLLPQQIDSARAFMALQFEAVRGGAARDRFEEAIPDAKSAPWYRYTWGGVPRDSWLWSWWRPIVDFDPVDVLPKVKVPVLAIFGLEDELTIKEDVPGFLTRMEDALARGGNTDFTGVLVPDVGHDLYLHTDGLPTVPHPIFRNAMIDWLATHALRPNRP